VPASEDILSTHWYSVSEALKLPQEEVFRHKKLCAILVDVQENRHFPCDVMRDIPPETWES
jgi:hypothetical protein